MSLYDPMPQEPEPDEDYPYVCPDCYASGEMSHDRNCPEEARQMRAGGFADEDATDYDRDQQDEEEE